MVWDVWHENSFLEGLFDGQYNLSGTSHYLSCRLQGLCVGIAIETYWGRMQFHPPKPVQSDFLGDWYCGVYLGCVQSTLISRAICRLHWFCTLSQSSTYESFGVRSVAVSASFTHLNMSYRKSVYVGSVRGRVESIWHAIYFLMWRIFRAVLI